MKIISLLLHGMCLSNNKIKNFDNPSCKNCVNFIHDGSYEFGKCKLFGDKNLVTNEINNDYANRCRDSEDKCGVTGKYFQRMDDLLVLLRDIKNNRWLPLILFISLEIVAIIVVKK